MPTRMTHEKLEERREKVRNKDKGKFLTHSQRRYALFRVQNYLLGGASPEPEHLKISKKLEKEVEPLGGILAFAKRWDVDATTGDVVLRDRSVWVAHEQFMDKAAHKLNIRETKKEK